MSISSTPLSPLIAWYGSLLGPVLYVAPFYLSPTLQTSNEFSRDDPRIIQARVRAVAWTCGACTALAVSLLTLRAGLSMTQTLKLLGAYSFNLLDIARTVSLTIILFIGPLYEQIAINHTHRHWSLRSVRQGLWESWTGYRNLVVAPISEELVFRSFVIALYLAADRPANEIIFGSPLVFGVAHFHHLVDFLRSHTEPGQRGPSLRVWVIGIIRSLVQFTYTSLFGFFAAFVYLRTGNVFACIAAHVFCNWQGVPRVWGRVGGLDGSSQLIGPTIVYYLLLAVGATAFAMTLWPLTESTNSLVAW